MLEHVACRRYRLLRGPDVLLSPCHVMESLHRLEYLGCGAEYLGCGAEYLGVDLGHPFFQAAQALFKLLTLVFLRAPCSCEHFAATLCCLTHILCCLTHILCGLADCLTGVTLLFSGLAETFRLSASCLCLQTPALCIDSLALGMVLWLFCMHGGGLHGEPAFDSLTVLFSILLSVWHGLSFFGV
jgi:hypothetical protein